MMNQKDAVFQVISETATFENGVAVLTKDQRSTVIAALVAGFQAGDIDMGNASILSDEAKLKSYTSGLVSNWLKKDKRLNGGTKYVPKSTGARVSDPQIKEMRKLLGTFAEGTTEYSEVSQAIAARQAELNAAKAPTINFEVLPESLRKFSA